MNKPAICHITTVHSYGDVRILKKECYTLVENGYDVSLILSTANLINDERVRVISIGKLPTNRLLRFIIGYKRASRSALHSGAHIFHIHDPELLFLGWRLVRKGYRVIYDAHEDVPRQILSKHYLPVSVRGIVSWLTEQVENWFVHRLTGVVAATPIIASRFSKENPNTISVCNYPSLHEFPEPTEWNQKRNHVCYVGGIFAVRGAFEMVGMLHQTIIRLNLAGTYSPESLRDKLVLLPGWKQVDELGFVGRNQISAILGSSLAGLVLLHPLQSYQESLPVKMFEYMAAGIPVIASDFSLWRTIVADQNCGVCCNPLNMKEIRSTIDYLYNNQDKAQEMGRNGRNLVVEKYNWENEAIALLSFYHRIVHTIDNNPS